MEFPPKQLKGTVKRQDKYIEYQIVDFVNPSLIQPAPKSHRQEKEKEKETRGLSSKVLQGKEYEDYSHVRMWVPPEYVPSGTFPVPRLSGIQISRTRPHGRSPSYRPTGQSYPASSPSYGPTGPIYSLLSPSYSPVPANFTPETPIYSPAPPYYTPTTVDSDPSTST